MAECERDTPLFERPAAERFAGLADEAAESLLPDLLGDRYRVGRELGRGGMARVYLARDEKHGRDVAIKVIRPELSASLGHDRFLREIEIAARLRHPNIVPLYDSGEVDGSLYFVMPYEEGPSLRERLTQGPLPIADALSVLRDVARALAYAHEHGVVHRDVKPDNVMLSGGAAVVTDFGIAKAVSAALTDSHESHADPNRLGHRNSGLHGAGAGHRGSIDRSPRRHLLVRLPGVRDLHRQPAVCQSVDAPGHRRAHRDGGATGDRAAGRCACAGGGDDCPLPGKESGGSAPERAGAAGVTRPRDRYEHSGTQASAATTMRRPARTFRWAWVAVIVGVIGAAGYFATRPSGRSAPITVAVLPFGNIGADSALSYVAEGLADEVAGALARVPGIQIKSRSGARAYRGQLGPDVTEAGARLKADYLITGVVRQERGRWILSAELARAADKASLWGENFNLGADQQAGAAEAIADTLVAAMRGMFPKSIGTAPALASNQKTSNSEAFRLYLRGQDKLDHRGPNVSVRESAELFRAAIHEDTLYARAYSGLSMALVLFPYFAGRSPDGHPGRRAERGRPGACARLHTGRNPTSPWECSMGTTSSGTARSANSRRRSGSIAATSRPGSSTGGSCCLAGAQRTDCASSGLPARRTPPRRWCSAGCPMAYYLDGQMDSALVESRRALENGSDQPDELDWERWCGWRNNLPEEARKLADRATPGGMPTCMSSRSPAIPTRHGSGSSSWMP